MKRFELSERFGIESLRIVDRPRPVPEAGHVLLQMLAFSLNYRDLLVVKGLYNPNLPLPLVPLSDGVGRVVEIGEGVSRVKRGDRIAGNFVQDWISGQLTDAKAKTALGGGHTGLLAEYVVLHQDSLVHIPEYLSDEEAATLPCAGLTAWHALVSAGHVAPGDTILTQGTGGVSIFALQFARLAGARVIGTSSSDAKLARARQLGLSDGINYKTVPDWDKRARELTNNQGVDHVVEVGGGGTLTRSLRATRHGGRISLIGILSHSGEVNLTPALMKNICIQGIFVGSREMFEAMNQAIALHRLRPVIDRIFPFDEAPAAFRHLESGAHFGKVCIRV
jgi:NADPH:quinone reductase-like Zn-dependent oxidoreductase